MAPQPPTTNLDDVLNEIRVMNQRIGTLEQWKIATDAAQAAVEKYKADEALAVRNRLQNKESNSKTDLFKQGAYVMGLLGVLLYFYLHSKGIL